ncbi:MAG: putative porin [Myxococcota bacterium]
MSRTMGLSVAAAAWTVGVLGGMAPEPAMAVELRPFGQIDVRYHGWFVFGEDPVPMEAETQSDDLINRPEARVRLGLELEPNKDGMEAVISLVTGDPKVLATQWQPLGALDDPRTISLERAWFGTRPDLLPELRARIGRVPIPWSRTGLLWDPQVTLPGLWVDYTYEDTNTPRSPSFRVDAGIAYLIADGPNIRDESLLRGIGLAATLPVGQTSWLDFGVGYTDLSGAKELGQAIGREEVVVAQRPPGFTANTTPTDADNAEAELTQRLVDDGLANDFNLISVDGEFKVDFLEHLPFLLQAHLSWNVGAEGPGDPPLGVLAGLGLGDMERPGRGQLRLRYLRIAADAALDLFNREHYSTNLEGVELTGALLVSQGWTVGFVSLYSWQVDTALRGLGDGRGEPYPGDPSSLRMFVNTGYAF